MSPPISPSPPLPYTAPPHTPPLCSCVELWELDPSLGPSYPTTDGGRLAVRVLFNREALDLPGAAPGKLMGLSTFERELLGGFILSEQDHQQVRDGDTTPLTMRETLAGCGMRALGCIWLLCERACRP